MAAARPLAWLDVFTATPLAGNALAVVQDADGLSDETMLAFARETMLSETTFVQSPSAPEADYRNRIWMAVRELPFAGHPSLGTAVAVAARRGQREASYTQETRAGLQPIDVRATGERCYRASMLQEPATFGDELDAAEVLAGAGLDADAADPELPPQLVSTGTVQLLVPVRGGLERARPDAARVRALLEPHDATTLYVADCDVRSGRARARAFFPQPDGSAGEDPATGSAVGPLMAYLHRRAGLERMVVEQGVEMGRASRLECAIEGDRVRVGGDVVLLAEGTLFL